MTDSTKVRVAVTGEVSVAPTGTAAPTDADTALPAAFKALGFVSEDGVTETRDRSTNDIKAWQNAATVRTVVTDATLTYQMTLIETNADTVELFYGTTVDGVEGSFAIIPASTGGRKSFVIDVVDGDELIRTYVPSGEVTEVGDRVYASGEPIGYDVTITAYPDNTGKAAEVFTTALAA